MKKTLFYLALLFIIPQSFASSVQIEPLYGVERSQRFYPEPARFVTKTFVGIRALYGVDLLSAEFELAQSQNTETFPTQDLTVKYTEQRAMLGVRSYLINSNVIGWFARLGARAKQTQRDITETGVDRTEKDALQFDPYAGTGLTIRLADVFSLNAGATLVYNRNNDPSNQYDTQYTFSFTFRAGNTR
jgi:hypothetical protein